MALMPIDRRRAMKTSQIATVALIACISFSCGSSGEGKRQDSGRETSPPAKDASEEIKEVSTSQLKDWLATGQPLTLIDVREDNEWQGGHAAAATHISRWTLSDRIGTVVPDKNARIVLYCLGGVRSAAAAATVQRMGYTNVFSLAGGFKGYQLAGLPIQR
jgi:rhodanese-related sulfurtransferase